MTISRAGHDEKQKDFLLALRYLHIAPGQDIDFPKGFLDTYSADQLLGESFLRDRT